MLLMITLVILNNLSDSSNYYLTSTLLGEDSVDLPSSHFITLIQSLVGRC